MITIIIKLNSVYVFFLIKIIIRARRKHLFDEYAKKERSLEDLKADIREAIKLNEEKMNAEQDKDKKVMYFNMLTKCKQTIEKYSETKTQDSNQDSISNELISNATDILSTWLDKLHSNNVTDNSIFSKLPRFYEGEFHKDMSALNVI